MQRSAGTRVRVPQLEQLHRPLDVGQAAPAELGVGVRVGAAGQSFGLHPGLDPADLDDLLAGQPAGRVADRVDQLSNSAPRSASPQTNRARSSACASHTFDQRA